MSVPAQAQASTAASAGATYSEPKDWTAKPQGAATIYVSPEKDLNVAVVNVASAPDAKAAAAKAWSAYKPDISERKIHLLTPAAPGDGWDERVQISYETSPTEKMVVSALVMRKDDAWTVMITDGADATANKRYAALSILQESIRPAGYQAETFAGKTAHSLTPERIELLRQFVADSARTLDVPGVGIALIDGGKVVWEGGVGVRALGSPEPVDEHTKFMVASNTKGMATLLLSTLADDGMLDWDTPVTSLYPSFRLGSDETTKSTLVRHLVCACTGLPRRDYAFILADAGAPATDTFRQLAESYPTSDFGELFQYNNLMASAAGYLGGALAYPEMELGAAFDRAMDERIFEPLAMVDTTFDFEKAMSGNWARPHGLNVDGQVEVIPNDFNFTVDPHRPAGGVWSTAADMAHYVQLELSKGLGPDGKRVVSEENLLERRKRGVPVGENSWYGMGLFEKIAWGVPVVTHGGTLLGYRSNFFALPEADIGAVILTNADSGSAMIDPFFRRLMEVLYDGKPEAAAEIAVIGTRIKAQSAKRRAELTVPGDATVLANLAEKYVSPGIGTITISEKNGTKWIKAGFVEGPIATDANADGSISLVSAAPGAIGLTALVGEADGKRTLMVRDAQDEYIYTEVR
ncbi:serine hydrolase domain-containing protein [Parasphingorhabdus sp.]|uniref:serine hydrolase domain-containing protein n=1 Tax=Parasphingorhabdus sp. TaxID=2709688 RepID=UPI00300165DC